MIQIRHLIKAFGSRVVLRDLSLTVELGEFVVLLGRNGAGKTTLMNILATLSRATGGQVIIGGLDVSRQAVQIRRYIGLVSHKTLLYDDLSGEENLRFYAKMYDLYDRHQVQTRIERVLSQVGLQHRGKDAVRTYSRGLQQRLAIARAILHDPPLLLLDEPDTGLDEAATTLLSDLLTSVDVSRRTVVMTSHNLERAVNLSSRVLILAKGKIQYDAARGEVRMDEVRAAYLGN